MLGDIGELLLPRKCAGCGVPGQLLCATCRMELAHPPQRVFPNTTPMVPVFALGAYAGAHRGVVLAMKERNHLAVRRHVGAVLNAGLDYLEARGDIAVGAVLVPAPTKVSSARARGGDPVEAICRATRRSVAPALLLDASAADQSNLDESSRRANLSGAVRLAAIPAGPVVLIDDVVTTGATLQASVSVLLAHGVDVSACVTVCAA